MNKTIAIIAAAIIIVGGGGYLLLHKSDDNPNNNSQPAASDNSQPAESSNAESNSQPASTQQSGAMNVTVQANDSSSTPSTVTAKKGQVVNLTFSVMTNGTYHGGLQFTSDDPQLDSGAISPGSSKTITFTADKSFSFTPWWPQKSVKKDYVVTVNVQ